VLPYFLHPGNHTSVDLPAIVEAARARHAATAIELLHLFGADPALADAVAAQARRALADGPS
jgi:sirohydrochlorin ferrochelatase